MNCDFALVGKHFKCERCGATVRDEGRDVMRNCTGPPGWGDMLAATLARIGLTQTRYRHWKVRWGLADACGCAERKEKLNRFGRWIAKWRKRIKRWMKCIAESLGYEPTKAATIEPKE